jgi:hypothetical protein
MLKCSTVNIIFVLLSIHTNFSILRHFHGLQNILEKHVIYQCSLILYLLWICEIIEKLTFLARSHHSNKKDQATYSRNAKWHSGFYHSFGTHIWHIMFVLCILHHLFEEVLANSVKMIRYLFSFLLVLFCFALSSLGRSMWDRVYHQCSSRWRVETQPLFSFMLH